MRVDGEIDDVAARGVVDRGGLVGGGTGWAGGCGWSGGEGYALERGIGGWQDACAEQDRGGRWCVGREGCGEYAGRVLA